LLLEALWLRGSSKRRCSDMGLRILFAEETTFMC
jgi:hypothetical protein